MKCCVAAPDGLQHGSGRISPDIMANSSRASTRPPAASASASKASQNRSKSSSLRSRRAQALSWWLVAFSVRMNPAGRPWAPLVRSKASKGLVGEDAAEVEEHRLDGRARAHGRAQPSAVAGQPVPQLGRQTERGHVDPLVDPVEHGGVVLEGERSLKSPNP